MKRLVKIMILCLTFILFIATPAYGTDVDDEDIFEDEKEDSDEDAEDDEDADESESKEDMSSEEDDYE